MNLGRLMQFELSENYVPMLNESSPKDTDELRYIDAV